MGRLGADLEIEPENELFLILTTWIEKNNNQMVKN